MMRYALAALLALVIGSQADAQLIRRYARPAYTPGYTHYYGSPSYSTSGTVVTAGYYSPSTWSSGYVYPSSYYSSPTVGFGVNLGYYNSGYSNYGYGYSNRYSGGWGRRGWRW